MRRAVFRKFCNLTQSILITSEVLVTHRKINEILHVVTMLRNYFTTFELQINSSVINWFYFMS